MNRRAFLSAACFGPWAITSGVLMPVRDLWKPATREARLLEAMRKGGRGGVYLFGPTLRLRPDGTIDLKAATFITAEELLRPKVPDAEHFVLTLPPGMVH